MLFNYLTILSFGGGQDSHAILYKIVHDPLFKLAHVFGRLIVVFADTGNEYPYTYLALRKAKLFCKDNGIEFYHLKPGSPFHAPAAQSLVQQMKRNHTLPMCCGPKSCTHKFKIDPIYKFVEHYLGTELGLKHGRKKAMKEFVANGGKIKTMIGFTKGEEKRVQTPKAIAAREKTDLWWKCIKIVYPLIDEGMTRDDCIEYIKATGHDRVFPSNCMFCPFLNKKHELLYLERFHPAALKLWIRLEKDKIKTNMHMGKKNLGAFGSMRTIPWYLAKAKKALPNVTDTELENFRFTHGHCGLKSKY